MFAAAVAAERRVPCLILERKARLGSKVLMTANGRCNFAKDIPPDQFLRDLGEGSCAEFVAEAVRECPPRQICRGFQSLGVRTKRMADGRLFPADEKAATIVHALGDLLRDEGVPILSNCAATAVKPLKNGFLVATKNFTLWAENVLVATGGASYPKTGSVGDGQSFAKALGHSVVPYRPGLIGLETRDPKVTSLAGRRFEDGAAKVLDQAGKTVFECRGEIDCESFGLSGAATYNAQRFIEHCRQKQDLAVEASFGGTTVRLDKICPRPLKEAIVTIGGVDTREIDPRTMQSKIVPGLYFAGEVMDIDGPTGGYNLTLAFATARKAVAGIAQKQKEKAT